jgi:hypothetical protein
MSKARQREVPTKFFQPLIIQLAASFIGKPQEAQTSRNPPEQVQLPIHHIARADLGRLSTMALQRASAAYLSAGEVDAAHAGASRHAAASCSSAGHIPCSWGS